MARSRTPNDKKRTARPRRSAKPAAGEFELLEAIRETVARHGHRKGSGVVVGIGDDAAIVRSTSQGGESLVLTTDTMVENVHFRRAWLSAPQIGVRAYRAAVSDIAAMGARPRWVLLSLELPAGRRGLPGDDVVRLIRALSADARRSGASLVGGNVSRGPAIAVTTTVVGETSHRPARRSGAKSGHLVFVTGALGAAAAGRNALAVNAATSAARGYRVPPVRIDFAADVVRFLSAMIDVSDGLLQDTGHIAAESGVTIALDRDAIPVARAARGSKNAIDLALGGGEDYELVFTAPRAQEPAIMRLARKHRVPVTRIGVVRRGKPAVTDLDGKRIRTASAGFDHLKPKARRATGPVRRRTSRATA